MIGGKPNHTTRQAAAEYAGIDIVDSSEGAFLREPAREAMTRMLDQQPRIDAVLAANDSMALGVLDALKAAGRSKLVAGINAIRRRSRPSSPAICSALQTSTR